MKRFHVHLHVGNLDASLKFYSKLFGAEPARVEADYAKWMLEDPPLNFAISTRGESEGLDHFGFQTETADELAALRERAASADLATLDEGETTCCYARSEKHWITDPDGHAWEHFHTLGNIPVFREEAGVCATPGADATPAAEPAGACCAPKGKPVGIPVKAASGCC